MVAAMSPIAVFGATGLTGRLVVQRVLAQGVEVVAPLRNPGPMAFEHPNLFVMEGPPKSLADFDRCVSVADAVISCLGPPALNS